MNQSLPQEPIKWFKNGMLEQQVEWSKKEKELLVLLAQADLLFLIAQLFAPPTAHLQEMLKIEIPDIKELLESSNLPENLAEIYQQFRRGSVFAVFCVAFDDGARAGDESAIIAEHLSVCHRSRFGLMAA